MFLVLKRSKLYCCLVSNSVYVLLNVVLYLKFEMTKIST